MLSISLTVFFDTPFWAGLLARSENGRLSVAMVVFGAEPSDPEIYNWASQGMRGAVFSPNVECAVAVKISANPKRRQRQAARAMSEGIGTKSQQALQHARENAAHMRKAMAKVRREEYDAHVFSIKQAKHKEKHRGH